MKKMLPLDHSNGEKIMEFTDIQVGDLTLQRKVKFHVIFEGEDPIPCISADHASLVCKTRNIMLSQADIYTWNHEDRPKKKLSARWPANVQVIKL